MSLIHLDKSVITFHFKEILEDGHLGGPLTLVGLGALILGPKLLSSLTESVGPATNASVKSGSPYRPQMSLSDWVANAMQQQKASTAQTVDENTPVSELKPAQTLERLAA
ncbi:MAG: hypothetical protein F6J95_018235 [Leptolyngbya sp. SIO1E4]|nr:hypothetical protein [Leptolyngbya sp. SIO1E4]